MPLPDFSDRIEYLRNKLPESGVPVAPDLRTFSTGSVRDVRTNKGRYDLLSPFVEERDALHMERGGVNYGDRNWELGQPLSVYYDSAHRHMTRHWQGLEDEDHLAAARWNIAAIMHTEEMIRRGLLPAELNDRPNYQSKT